MRNGKMGGTGSGWQGERKTTVEEGLILDIKDLDAMGALVPRSRKGSLSWRSAAENNRHRGIQLDNLF
jgi:hypothetical protein